jgi:hypothetical protein
MVCFILLFFFEGAFRVYFFIFQYWSRMGNLLGGDVIVGGREIAKWEDIFQTLLTRYDFWHFFFFLMFLTIYGTLFM